MRNRKPAVPAARSKVMSSIVLGKPHIRSPACWDSPVVTCSFQVKLAARPRRISAHVLTYGTRRREPTGTTKKAWAVSSYSPQSVSV